MRAALLALFVFLGVGGAAAQEDTLADIRQELAILFVELQRLKQELSTTGTPSVAQSGSVLSRVNALEARVQSLTGKTEELEFRIDRVVRDGTNRVGDLEFRLCELEEGCDIASLGETPSLGGVDAAPVAPPQPVPNVTGLAVNEQSDFQAAQAALDAGDFTSAADLFASFVKTYPGGPLTVDAQVLQGQAHRELGEMQAAARAYLAAFTFAPNGPRAPEALFELGSSLAALGQVNEACLTLGEVMNRFPGGEFAARAASAEVAQGC
ncbi:MAG: tol-pal system protein YbgF [Pseudomonadota bacterium]